MALPKCLYVTILIYIKFICPTAEIHIRFFFQCGQFLFYKPAGMDGAAPFSEVNVTTGLPNCCTSTVLIIMQ